MHDIELRDRAKYHDIELKTHTQAHDTIIKTETQKEIEVLKAQVALMLAHIDRQSEREALENATDRAI